MTRSIRKLIGARILAHRKGAKVTQAALAEAIDCDETTVGRYERGETTLDTEQLVKMAAFFQVSALDFLPTEKQVEWQVIQDLRSVLIDLVHRIDDKRELDALITVAREACRRAKPRSPRTTG